MPRSESMDRAIKKYEQEKVDRVIFRVPKGMKEQIQEHAQTQGESLAAFLNRAVQETILRCCGWPTSCSAGTLRRPVTSGSFGIWPPRVAEPTLPRCSIAA